MVGEVRWIGWRLLRRGGGIQAQGSMIHVCGADQKTLCGRRLPLPGYVFQWYGRGEGENCQPQQQPGAGAFPSGEIFFVRSHGVPGAEGGGDARDRDAQNSRHVRAEEVERRPSGTGGSARCVRRYVDGKT